MQRLLIALGASMLALSGCDGIKIKGTGGISDAHIAAVIEQTLKDKPEIIVNALMAMQQKQGEAALEKLSPELLKSSNALVINPKGQHTIVEFMDYQCGYCKVMHPLIQSLAEKNPNIRVLVRPVAFLGPESKNAAATVLSVQDSQKQLALHNLLMSEKKRLNASIIAAAVQTVGLDATTVQKTAAARTATQPIEANMALTRDLNINGTPAFIFFTNEEKPHIVPGAMSAEQLASYSSKMK